jgi:hypothetical protein
MLARKFEELVEVFAYLEHSVIEDDRVAFDLLAPHV